MAFMNGSSFSFFINVKNLCRHKILNKIILNFSFFKKVLKSSNILIFILVEFCLVQLFLKTLCDLYQRSYLQSQIMLVVLLLFLLLTGRTSYWGGHFILLRNFVG